MTNDLVKKIEPNAVGIRNDDVLPPEMMQALEDKLPAWVKEQAADGTAVMRWMHEYLILMEEILRLDFGFQEKDMVKIEKRIKELLPQLHKMKMENTKLLRKADFAVAIDIVERNKALGKMEQSKIAHPTAEQILSLKGKNE